MFSSFASFFEMRKAFHIILCSLAPLLPHHELGPISTANHWRAKGTGLPWQTQTTHGAAAGSVEGLVLPSEEQGFVAWVQATPRPGDLIELFHLGYEHWAVYVGDGYMVHLAPPIKITGPSASSLPLVLADKAIVKKELLSVVAGTHRYCVNNKHDDKYTPLPPSKIVQRAEALVGKEFSYNIFTKNCEHFVNQLRYRVSRSDQVTDALLAIEVTVGFFGVAATSSGSS